MTGLTLSLILGFAPMILFASWVYWVDRYEKEPRLILGGMFLWGAIVAAGGAFLINSTLGLGVYMFTGSEAFTDLATGSLIAPVVEELLKGFAVLVVFLVFRSEFDTLLDGMVYAAIVALGFAATENAFYIYTFGYEEGGLEGILGMFVIRVLMVGWQHPFYTAFTGIGFAVARLSRNAAIRLLAVGGGLSLAIFSHSAHNTIAGVVSNVGGLVAATVLDWVGWGLMFAFLIWAVYREKGWLRQYLRSECDSGVISEAQFRAACSASGRGLACLGAFFSGGYRETKRFYQLTAELAYKKHQLASLGNERGNTAAIAKYRHELALLSPLAKS